MIKKQYADFAWEQTAALLAIDSPSGFTQKAAVWVKDAFSGLGFDANIPNKGGVLVDFGGDEGIINELYNYLNGDYKGFCAADIDTSVKNHL